MHDERTAIAEIAPPSDDNAPPAVDAVEVDPCSLSPFAASSRNAANEEWWLVSHDATWTADAALRAIEDIARSIEETDGFYLSRTWSTAF